MKCTPNIGSQAYGSRSRLVQVCASSFKDWNLLSEKVEVKTRLNLAIAILGKEIKKPIPSIITLGIYLVLHTLNANDQFPQIQS